MMEIAKTILRLWLVHLVTVQAWPEFGRFHRSKPFFQRKRIFDSNQPSHDTVTGKFKVPLVFDEILDGSLGEMSFSMSMSYEFVAPTGSNPPSANPKGTPTPLPSTAPSPAPPTAPTPPNSSPIGNPSPLTPSPSSMPSSTGPSQLATKAPSSPPSNGPASNATPQPSPANATPTPSNATPTPSLSTTPTSISTVPSPSPTASPSGLLPTDATPSPSSSSQGTTSTPTSTQSPTAVSPPPSTGPTPTPVTPTPSVSAAPSIPPRVVFSCINNGLSLGDASHAGTTAVSLVVTYGAESSSLSTADFIGELENQLLLTAVAAALGCGDSRLRGRSLLSAQHSQQIDDFRRDHRHRRLLTNVIGPCQATMAQAQSCNIMETGLLYHLNGGANATEAAEVGYSAIERDMSNDVYVGVVPTVVRLEYMRPLQSPVPPQLTIDGRATNPPLNISGQTTDFGLSAWTIGACVATIVGVLVSVLIWSKNRQFRSHHIHLVDDASITDANSGHHLSI